MNEFIGISRPYEFMKLIGTHFSSSLVQMDQDTEDVKGFTKHLEYHPMVNSRAHLVGSSHKIMNGSFRATYDSFMRSMIQKPTLSTED